MYLYLNINASTNDVIFSFNYYLQANPKLYVVYIDANLLFTSSKLHIYFQKKDIIVVFVSSTSYKFFVLIEKSNNIL